MIDEGTEFGARAARHLRDEIVIWLTTVTPAGSPLPAPVWFTWDGADSVVMYSMSGSTRVRNLEANPRVALHFDGDGQGGDIVVISGRAEMDAGIPTPDRNDAYLAKYDAHIERIGLTRATFAQRYDVPVRIRFTRVRGH